MLHISNLCWIGGAEWEPRSCGWKRPCCFALASPAISVVSIRVAEELQLFPQRLRLSWNSAALDNTRPHGAQGRVFYQYLARPAVKSLGLLCNQMFALNRGGSLVQFTKFNTAALQAT